MINLKEYRDEAEGFADLLNYAHMIEDGIMLNKNGSFMSVFEYRSNDIFSATKTERNILSAQVNNVLKKLSGGWAVQFDCIRTPTKEYFDVHKSFFPEPVSYLIDQERKWTFTLDPNVNLYENRYYFTLTYVPPPVIASKITRLVFEDDSRSEEKNLTEELLNHFKSKVEEFASLAENCFVKVRQLKQYKKQNEDGTYIYFDEILEFLNTCIVGRSHPMAYPCVNSYCDVLLAKDFITGVTPMIEDQFIRTIIIDGYPIESFPNILDALSNFDIDYRWNTRFKYMDEFEFLKVVDNKRKLWKSKQKGILAQIFNSNNGPTDLDAVRKTAETEEAKADVSSGVVVGGYITNAIVIFDKKRDIVDAIALEIKKRIESLGFGARIDEVNSVEAYLGSLPGHLDQNLRQTIVNTLNLSHLIPLSTLWQGDKENQSNLFPKNSPALMKTIAGSTPFYLNLHVEDLGHTLIFGPTGAGKSTLLATLVAQAMRYPNAKIFAFDKGMSLFPLTLAAGGNHFNVGGDDDSLSFAPFSNIKTQSEKDFSATLVVIMAELQGLKLTPAEKQALHHALELHIKNGSKSLTEYISSIQSIDLRDALSHYSIAGSMGRLLDAEEDNLSFSNFNTFEIEELMNLKMEDALPVLLYIFNRIEKSLDGSPAFLVLDEAWLMLGHPVFRDKIKEWLKVFRKKNCAVILATQSLSDVAKSGMIDVLVENCKTKIYLPNPVADQPGSENTLGPIDYYRSFGLNDRQIEIIKNAENKREYYFTNPYGSRLINLYLKEFALAFVAASGAADIKKIKELRDIYGDNWVEHWLKHRNVAENIIEAYKDLKAQQKEG